jgi:hypothetical protein
MTDPLDTLLSAPLAPVADNGFTDRVMTRVAEREFRFTWFEVGALAACAIVLMPFVPVQPVLDVAVDLSAALANSQYFAAAALATIASLWFLRYAAE